MGRSFRNIAVFPKAAEGHFLEMREYYFYSGIIIAVCLKGSVSIICWWLCLKYWMCLLFCIFLMHFTHVPRVLYNILKREGGTARRFRGDRRDRRFRRVKI
jgi:hypothetical protein